MGFTAGNLACTRFQVIALPEPPNFEAEAFRLIQPGSNFLESHGFIPFDIDEPYEFGKQRYAFRVRIDRISVDATAVKERLRELIKTELDRGERLGSKKKKRLKDLATSEIQAKTLPRTKIIEGVIDGQHLYIGTTSKSHLGTVLTLLKRIGIEVEIKTPWLERGLDEEEVQGLIDLKEPGQSLHGCHFLKFLLDDPEIMVEPEKGSVKLATHSRARVTLSGEVLGELEHYLEEGAILLAAKLLFVDKPMMFDGLAYRLNSLKLPVVKGSHWTEILDTRLEHLAEVWSGLDGKFAHFLSGSSRS